MAKINMFQTVPTRTIGMLDNATFEKLIICPHCGISNDALIIAKSFLDENSNFAARYLALLLRCTSCQKAYFTLYLVKDNNKYTFLYSHPHLNKKFFSDNIKSVSPRFIDLYNEAITAEENNCITLAVIGYRSALEVLIKDYAINELHLDTNEVISKTLNKSIELYLSNELKEIEKSADFIRILGNDYTHYVKKYPFIEFETIKFYMEHLILAIDSKIRLNHPPIPMD